jgi:hypothetical protein
VGASLVVVIVRREKALDSSGTTPARKLVRSITPVAEAAISGFDLLKRGAFS